MLLNEREIRKIVRKRILAETAQPARTTIGSVTVRQEHTGGPYIFDGGTLYIFEDLGASNDSIEQVLQEVLKPSNYSTFENELTDYMTILGLTTNDLLLYPERGGENSIHNYAKRLTDETLEYGFAGFGTGQGNIGGIMRDLGSKVTEQNSNFSLFDMSRLAKYFKDKKNALSGQTSALGYLIGRSEQEATADLDRILLYDTGQQSELNAADILEFVIDPFIEGAGQQTAADLIAYRIKKGATLTDGTTLPQAVSVTCKELEEGLYAGKYTPGYDIYLQNTTGGAAGGGSGSTSGGTPGASTSTGTGIVGSLLAQDLVGTDLVQKLEYALDKYVLKHQTDPNMRGMRLNPDSTYDAQTDTVFDAVVKHGLGLPHPILNVTPPPAGNIDTHGASGTILTNLNATSPAFKNMELINRELAGDYPGYTDDLLGKIAVVLDLYNKDVSYGARSKSMTQSMRNMVVTPGATGGGGTGGGGTGGGGTPQIGGTNTLAATGNVLSKINAEVIYGGTGVKTLEDVGFPAGAGASADQTTLGLKRLIVSLMPKNRTTTGGKVILRVVVNRSGVVKNVRVASESTNKSYDKRFARPVENYLTRITPNTAIYTNLPGGGRTKFFNVVIDIGSGMY
jgi:hypothetical protein